jgi:hypothetical protein
MLRRRLGWSSAVAVVLLVSLTSPAWGQTFVFHLRGDQLVPPVPSPASGGCFGQLDQPAGQFALTCVHDAVRVTAIQIHRGAAGVNGPIAFTLDGTASPLTATWTGMTAADIAELLAGNLHVVIHTACRQAGEIRGQILARTVDLVNFVADGAQVVPADGTAATAACTADLDGPATSLAVQCTHDLPGASAAHLHQGPAGQNGPAVFTFASAASPVNANIPVTRRLVADYAATFLYLDIHGTGAIRGQVGTPPPAVAPSTSLSVVAPPVATANVPFTFTVQACDEAGNAVTGYTGTVQFSTTPPGGAVPADYTFTVADAGVKTFADGATLTGGENTLTATDADDPLITGTSLPVLVFGPTANLFVFDLRGAQVVPPVSTPATGGCFGQFDAGQNVLGLTCVHNVAGATLAHIHRAAAGGTNPAIARDLGPPTSPLITLWTGMTPADVADLFAGNLYVDIHSACRPGGEMRGQILARTVDTVAFTANGAQVVPPDATPSTAACTADLNADATSLAVQCTHDLASPDTAHVHEAPARQTGPVVFTFPSAASPLSANVPMTPRLIADFAATFLAVDVHAESGSEIRGQIGTPPPHQPTHLSVTAPAAAVAGTPFSVTVTALDACDDVVTSYSGTVHFTTTDGGAGATVPADYTFTGGDAGVHQFTGGATLVTVGNQTITATDTASATVAGTSDPIAVSSGGATGFTVTAPAAATAGVPFTVTVTARDQFGNVASGYTGTVHFTTTDGGAGVVLPADYTFVAGDNGTRTFTSGVTLVTPGSRTVTAADTGNATITGTSNAIVLSAGAATRLALAAPPVADAGPAVADAGDAAAGRTRVAGTPFTFTVTALDQFGNVALGYGGTVHFTSTDALATLPSDSPLANGTGTFSATLRTAGPQTITGRDTVNSTIAGTTNVIVVPPAVATRFVLTAPASVAAGVAFTFTVTALDQFGNVATAYAGTVHITSNDPLAGLPPDAPLVNGVGTFSATLRSGGTRTLTATDTASSAITGGAAIAVSAAAIPALGTGAFVLLALLLGAVAVGRLCLRPLSRLGS